MLILLLFLLIARIQFQSYLFFFFFFFFFFFCLSISFFFVFFFFFFIFCFSTCYSSNFLCASSDVPLISFLCLLLCKWLCHVFIYPSFCFFFLSPLREPPYSLLLSPSHPLLGTQESQDRGIPGVSKWLQRKDFPSSPHWPPTGDCNVRNKLLF